MNRQDAPPMHITHTADTHAFTEIPGTRPWAPPATAPNSAASISNIAEPITDKRSQGTAVPKTGTKINNETIIGRVGRMEMATLFFIILFNVCFSTPRFKASLYPIFINNKLCRII